MLFINSILDKTNDDILCESIVSKISSAATSIKTKSGEISDNIGFSSVTWDKVIERYESRIADIKTEADKLKVINEITDEFESSEGTKKKIDSYIQILSVLPDKVKAYKILRAQLTRYESNLRGILTKVKNVKIVNDETKAADKQAKEEQKKKPDTKVESSKDESK